MIQTVELILMFLRNNYILERVVNISILEICISNFANHEMCSFDQKNI